MSESIWYVAIERAVNNNIPRVKSILERHQYILDARSRLRQAKLEVIRNLKEYVGMTMESVRRNGGNVYLAKDGGEARSIVEKIVGDRSTIVMGKSMVAYECGIRQHLINKGKEVWETDLGEFLIQLSNEPPSHIIAPAIHMTREQASKVIKKIDSTSSVQSHEEIAGEARKFLRQKFINAEVGITGANAISADTGSILLIENEGNIRMTSIMPEVHIAIAGVEKIVPTLEHAFLEVMVQSAYAGLYPPTYVNLTSGPSSTGDIEMKRVSPAHGPKEFHLILLDNGRFKTADDPILSEALLCIRCGRCHFHCPVYRVMGQRWGDPPFTGPMGAMWSYVVYGDSKPSLLCAHSGGCREVCPMDINIPKVLERIKYIAQK
ncbi:Lactate utilization protein B [Sulfuracidifex tepidarius]|uniref:Lactate utilization protein B n=1 Tax=Sulfuracidifex tepidarius TaxID=1294262 RepID=A0A510DRH2_9CREN|nr:lactate utilization protein B [Sulfuracidifex tepidarius]BBG22752.1 Lactate utilization protein B [Sulfuracidifex tepidarius]